MVEINKNSNNQKNILHENLFDSVLYTENSVFRNIRNKTIELGYRFNCKPDALWLQYRSFSLMSLTDILAQKSVPFCDNVSFLEKTVERGLNFNVDLAFLTTGMTRNPLFHESCHCVADNVLFRNTLGVSTEEQAIRYLFAEAYCFCLFQFCGLEAKSKESLIGCIINDIAILTPELNAFRQALQRFGQHNTMMIYMISHMLCMSQVVMRDVNHQLLSQYTDMAYTSENEELINKLISMGYSILPSFSTTVQAIFYTFVDLPRPTPEVTLSLFTDNKFNHYFQEQSFVLADLALKG
ncbi:hypothetical protein [Photorhabdus bodei]|uniref:Uncharacterized protein n=1 Tax=Photorhabdus bodei TaxID=2029681 RepID=A0ABX0APJ0_9GAMM|nr:hypothetical protein [Photorhabdus bodei]NDL00809.1 hypothetical protein [Photorhabdus bodei]NDL04975.1 hypothetical protein [Photorhabdus bodei]NDL09308.1 hypothetical protein [Photorhabdus bodei]